MAILSIEGFSDDAEFIQGRIPILTGTCKKTNMHFDISFNNEKGIEAADLIRAIVGKNKIVREALIFIKILLKINNLNETRTGGMGSFLLFNLVYYYYIIYKKKKYTTSHNTVGFYNSEKFNRNRFFNNAINDSEDENLIINNKLNLEYINSYYEDSDTEENTFSFEICDNKKNNKNNYIYTPNHDELRISYFFAKLFVFLWV